MLVRTVLFVSLLTAACSSKSKSQADCDAIANDIRSTLVDAGKSPSTPVCAASGTDPDTQKQFAAKCQALTDCNDNCCK